MDEILLPTVTVVVHPIDVAAHPTVPPGWRWAVQVGGRPPADLESCANAGYELDRDSALVVGERHAATAVQVARMFGVPLGPIQYLILGHDPIEAGNDRVRSVA